MVSTSLKNPFTKKKNHVPYRPLLYALVAAVALLLLLSPLSNSSTSTGSFFAQKSSTNDDDLDAEFLQLQTKMTSLQQKFQSYTALKERLHFLETQFNSYLSFGPQHPPNRGMTPSPSVTCDHSTDLREYCPKDDPDCGVDQTICLDDFPYGDCVIYDMGIRREPEFGEILSKDPFNCKVFAFDPSPVTKKWYKNSKLKKNPNYQLLHYAVGGDDGTIVLHEYNWNQVTIYQYPTFVVNKQKCSNQTGQCKERYFDEQEQHELPVRSLPSLMKELGHTKIDILKIDVEGSEYRVLESAIISGVCRHIDQLTLQWHHYDYDRRYGTVSVPHINMFVALLEEKCGLYLYQVYDQSGGWPLNDKIYTEMGITLMYNMAAFKRKKPSVQVQKED